VELTVTRWQYVGVRLHCEERFLLFFDPAFVKPTNDVSDAENDC